MSVMPEPPLGWTVADAREQFAKAGLPFDGLARVVSVLPGFRPVGAMPPGPNGGRRYAVYDIADMQQLHAVLSRWLIPRDPPPGDT